MNVGDTVRFDPDESELYIATPVTDDTGYATGTVERIPDDEGNLRISYTRKKDGRPIEQWVEPDILTVIENGEVSVDVTVSVDIPAEKTEDGEIEMAVAANDRINDGDYTVQNVEVSD